MGSAVCNLAFAACYSMTFLYMSTRHTVAPLLKTVIGEIVSILTHSLICTSCASLVSKNQAPQSKSKSLRNRMVQNTTCSRRPVCTYIPYHTIPYHTDVNGPSEHAVYKYLKSYSPKYSDEIEWNFSKSGQHEYHTINNQLLWTYYTIPYYTILYDNSAQ